MSNRIWKFNNFHFDSLLVSNIWYLHCCRSSQATGSVQKMPEQHVNDYRWRDKQQRTLRTCAHSDIGKFISMHDLGPRAVLQIYPAARDKTTSRRSRGGRAKSALHNHHARFNETNHQSRRQFSVNKIRASWRRSWVRGTQCSIFDWSALQWQERVRAKLSTMRCLSRQAIVSRDTNSSWYNSNDYIVVEELEGIGNPQ